MVHGCSAACSEVLQGNDAVVTEIPARPEVPCVLGAMRCYSACEIKRTKRVWTPDKDPPPLGYPSFLL